MTRPRVFWFTIARAPYHDFFFGKLAGAGAVKVQEVRVIGPDGKSWIALYRLERQDDGEWRIAAVRIALANAGKDA